MKPDITIVPARAAVRRDPRRCFTTRQKVKLFMRSKGRCDLCADMVFGTWIAGHVIAHSLGGQTVIDNGRVECLACGKQTHADDTTTAAECERMGGRTGQYARLKKNGSRLQSRGFNKTLRKKLNGQTERRT